MLDYVLIIKIKVVIMLRLVLPDHCVYCESEIGKKIGGYYIGMHNRNRVCVCDWCKMCLEDYHEENVSA